MSKSLYKVLIENKTVNIERYSALDFFKLQGFTEKEYNAAVNSHIKTFNDGKETNEMFKRAGNSISVDVINEIHKNLLLGRQQTGYQHSLLDLL